MPEALWAPKRSAWLAREWLDDSWPLSDWTSWTIEVSELLNSTEPEREDPFLDGCSFIIPMTRLSRWCKRLCILFDGLWRTGTVAYAQSDDRFLLTH